MRGIVFLLSLLSFVALALGQDTIVMLQTGVQSVRLDPGQSIVVLDPGGNDNYPGNCDSRLNIISNAGTSIRVHGWVSLDSPNDVVGVFNYRQDFFHNMVSRSGSEPIDVICTSSIAIISCWTNTYIHNRGYGLTVTAFSGEESTISDVNVDNITGTTADISWHDSSPAMEWTVKYGETPAELNREINTRTPEITLTGLRPHKTYFFKIFNNRTYLLDDTIESVHYFNTVGPPPVACIPYDELESQWVTCKVGEYYFPDQSEEIWDYGEYSRASRHTVCHDTSARDTNTGGLLRMIPEGFSTSVRLGNNVGGSLQESITYEYYVDTAVTPLLIMRYAAVLEDPDHDLSNQPKFTFNIYDIFELPIDSRCYSAQFVSNANMGWNNHSDTIEMYDGSTALFNNVMWKDWTAVGIDLAPLHGQTIFIRLSTYDCSQGGHYGYAYFVFECGSKAVKAENCGYATENVFTAPDGFSYNWYNGLEPEITLSDSQSLAVTETGDYYCTLGFVGAASGEACSFDISARSGYRYPKADYEVRIEGTDDCETYVRLVNRSVVTSDEARQNPIGEQCEESWWMIDDSLFVSSLYSPLFLLPPGSHEVTMVAILSGGACTDTVHGSFWVSNPCDDTVFAHVCAGTGYRLFDTTLFQPGVYERDSGYHHRTLFLDVGHQYDTVRMSIVVAESQLPFRWGGETFTEGVEEHRMNVRDMWGCDSIVIVDVIVVEEYLIHIDTSLCESQLPLVWGDSLLYEPGLYTQNFVNRWGLDSIVEIQLTVLPDKHTSVRAAICKGNAFTWIDGVTYYEPTSQPQWVLNTVNGCDSIINLILVEEPGIVASMNIAPRIVDFENDKVTLSDVTQGGKTRLWVYGDSFDTSRVAVFQFPADKDSLSVMLIASSANGCIDTAFDIVLADHAVVWAPNVFTPDEETNHEFRIFGHGLLTATATIYTRQGLFVTTFDALQEGWNGTYLGRPCPQAAYVWKLEYTTQAQPRQPKQSKGTVLLIR